MVDKRIDQTVEQETTAERPPMQYTMEDFWRPIVTPHSRSDPIGGSKPSSGCETIYWDSLPDFFYFYFLFFLKPNWYLWVWPTSYNRIKISKELPPEWCPSKSIHIYRVPFTNTKLYFYIYKSEHGTYM